MEKLIKWDKGFFDNTIRLYSNGVSVGYLKVGVWSRTSNGELDGKAVDLITKGFLQKETILIDSKTSQKIAMIFYNNWKSKATIKFVDRSEAQWEYTNFWHTKWILKKDLYSISYHRVGMKGEIVSYLPDEALIITGLFISKYFQRRRSVAASA